MRLEITKEWTQLLVFSDVESKSNVSWIWKSTSLIRRNKIITSYYLRFQFEVFKIWYHVVFFYFVLQIIIYKSRMVFDNMNIIVVIQSVQEVFCLFLFYFSIVCKVFCCWLMVFFYYLATVKSQKKGSNSFIFIFYWLWRVHFKVNHKILNWLAEKTTCNAVAAYTTSQNIFFKW